jgi:hypothetical protein
VGFSLVVIYRGDSKFQSRHPPNGGRERLIKMLSGFFH